MLNEDLIAYLQPSPNQFDANEWRDVCGAITDIRANDHRLEFRATLPPGLYRGALDLRPGSFDMKTATMPLTRVPDMGTFDVGPFDLDGIQQVMAMPMAKTYVNDRLLAGLWFTMPGPDHIAEGRLSAHFGFEAGEGETAVVLEFVERDRERIRWSDVRFLELRRDDRKPFELKPLCERRPRVYLGVDELPQLRELLPSNPLFQATVAMLKAEDLFYKQQCNIDLAAFVYLITGDSEIGAKLKKAVLDHCRRPTWSTRPDPLLMGGDNDRDVGSGLYYVGLAREYAFELFDDEERSVILAKAEEYLRKAYDFTVLQCGYMGTPSPDAHSVGAWAGIGIGCMCFYDDVPAARKAMPFFHGIFVESLTLYPRGGKTAWSTYFALHLTRYLAAAHTFGGHRRELDESPFLDRLGTALFSSYATPNPQELGRGLRTKEHRYLTAFLNRFHHTAGIEAIYRAFYAQESNGAGDVIPTIYDLLYAPDSSVSPLPFPEMPLFVRDIGDIICISRGAKTIGCHFNAGIKAGDRTSFSLVPHTREFTIPQANIELSVDDSPVIVDTYSYEQDSSLRNSMCFNEGGVMTQGQYLQGWIGPEVSATIRRAFLNERFVFAHANITATLHPKHGVRMAERIFLMDLKSGCLVLNDSFTGSQPIQFATHLHCSGKVTPIDEGTYRLTGGQADTIAGFGGRGLDDSEKGEIFATILSADHPHAVRVHEPHWFPPYIYGVNCKGSCVEENPRFPRYQRWRLEMTGLVQSGNFCFALSGQPNEVKVDGNRVLFPDGAYLQVAGNRETEALGCRFQAESLIVEPGAQRVVAIGARRIVCGERRLDFEVAVDLELSLTGKPHGFFNSPAADAVSAVRNFSIAVAQPTDVSTTNWKWSATFEAA